MRYYSCHQSIVVCSSPTSRFERERERERDEAAEPHTERGDTTSASFSNDTTTQVNPEIQIDLGPIGGDDDDDDDDGAFSFPFFKSQILVGKTCYRADLEEDQIKSIRTVLPRTYRVS